MNNQKTIEIKVGNLIYVGNGGIIKAEVPSKYLLGLIEAEMFKKSIIIEGVVK